MPEGRGPQKAGRAQTRTRMLLLWLRVLCRRFQHVPRLVPCHQASRDVKASRAG